ncbi:MAG: hypothetical protein N2170_02220 [Bacteroidia bacterium]|nr:hypothetical protein [Bacteroidia bacterium]
MKRIGWFILVLLGTVGGWGMGDGYYTALQERGKWRLRGEGILWDSAWAARHVEAVKVFSPVERLWEFWKGLQETELFHQVRVYYTGTGDVVVQAVTRTPAARVALPLRQYYVDREGHRLPMIRSLDLPIIELGRWDSVAIAFFLGWWSAKPWYHRAVSRLYQAADGIWYGYLEIASETFVLGRTPHLPTALSQWEVYLRAIQPKQGGDACRRVILHVPGQIVCETS